MGRPPKGDITKVSPQSPNSQSLKTTIPKKMAEDLGIEKGDYIKWTIVSHGRNKYAEIRRINLHD